MVYAFKVEAVDWSGNPSASGPSIKVTTASNSTPTVVWWIQYGYLFVIVAAAIGGTTAAIVSQRIRRKAIVAKKMQGSVDL